MTELDRTGNLLGALALVVADRMSDAIGAAARQSETGATALSALLHFLDNPSIDRLRQVLGLTSSGTVRLVDRLVEAGYVQRGPGGDGRSRTVTLTAAGREAAEAVAQARAEVLEGALAVLSPDQRTVLDDLAGTMLAGMIREPGATRWTCRLCDTDACGRYEGGCPVANEAQARYGA